MDVGEYSALFIAAELGNVELIELLITYGAKVNLSRERDWQTPLVFAGKLAK